jgi:hypothetical protein
LLDHAQAGGQGADSSDPVRSASGTRRHGDHTCRCGMKYRFLVLDGKRFFWPQIGHESFRVEPAETCVGCGWDLRRA